MSRDPKDEGPLTWEGSGTGGQEPNGKNGADSKPLRPPTVIDAARTIKAEDFLHVHQNPCARQGFLFGIGGGVAAGALRYVMRGK